MGEVAVASELLNLLSYLYESFGEGGLLACEEMGGIHSRPIWTWIGMGQANNSLGFCLEIGEKPSGNAQPYNGSIG